MTSGAPHPVGSGQCGNINPLGILGTPVIDATAGRIYVSEILNTDSLWHVFGIHHITVQIETAAFEEHPAPC